MLVGSIIYANDKILLVKHKSKWALPIGDIEDNAGVKEATLDFVKKLTGLDIEIKDFAGIFSLVEKRGEQEDVAIFVSKPISPNQKNLEDTKWIDLTKLEDISLVHTEIVDIVKNSLEDELEKEHVLLF